MKYLTYKKPVAEEHQKISVFTLNKGRYFEFPKIHSLVWSNADGSKNSIGVEIYRREPNKYFCEYLHFSYSSIVDDERKHFNYTVQLEKTPCNFGGYRFWFKCRCDKRVGVLYLDRRTLLFLCRNCMNLTYEVRNLNRKSSFFGLYKLVKIDTKGEELDKEIKRRVYNGKITRKQLVLLKLAERAKQYGNFTRQNYYYGN